LYNSEFYSYLASFATKSAEHIVTLLKAQLTIGSVADFGCGQGAWLSVWRKTGVSVVGVDGPQVDQQNLMIDRKEFRVADLSLTQIDLGQRFDLVQSLEVAEHLPGERSADFIQVLTAHAPLVMFSAAVPGQGGMHHVNEQPLEYWRKKFRDRNYLPIDCIRPQVVGNRAVQKWYRYNIVLYAYEKFLPELPDRLRNFLVSDKQFLTNYWPIPDRIRHTVIQHLPRRAVDLLSRVKAHVSATHSSKSARSPGDKS
jgi:SAM-dependent methyltransferase